MSYPELIQLYFERSNALFWYWTIYVVVIGGLLAFSSFRRRRDFVKTLLVSILYLLFAYKNLGAIREVSFQRFAVLDMIRNLHTSGQDTAQTQAQRYVIEPTLVAPDYEGVRNFHIVSDLLAVIALWAMERRRRLNQQPPPVK